MTAFSSEPALGSYWHPVARARSVSPGPIAVTLLGARYVLWRDADGALRGALDRCPHRDAPLSLGRVAEHGELECPYHGWRFDGGGRCTRVPSLRGDRHPKARLATAAVEERYGLAWLCPGRPAAAIPEIAEDRDPTFRRIEAPIEAWSAAATRMVDNFLDYAHLPFVHAASLGVAPSDEIGALRLEPMGDFHGYAYTVEVAGAGADGRLVRKMTTGFALPFQVRSTIDYATGLRHVLLLSSAPMDDRHTSFTFTVWRNDGGAGDEERTVALDRAIGAEDRTMLERIEGTLPLEAHEHASVASDRASLEWRRRFRALLA